jgi:hypothetical protein
LLLKMEGKLVRPHASAKRCVKQLKTQQRQRKGSAPLQTSLPDVVLGLRLVFLLLYYVQIKLPVPQLSAIYWHLPAM